ALERHGFVLGWDFPLPPSHKKPRDLRYLHAYPHMSRRENACMFIWLVLHPRETRQIGWAVQKPADVGISEDMFLVCETSLVIGNVSFSLGSPLKRLPSAIRSQGWQLLPGKEEPSFAAGMTIGQVLDHYFAR